MLFIAVCLFFISSVSLVIILTVLNASCIFSILISSLQSIFTITIMNSLSGKLLIHLSDLMSFYLALSFVLYFSIFFFFFFPNLLHLRSPFSQALGLHYFFVSIFALGGKSWLNGLWWFLVGDDLCLCSSRRKSSR